MIQSFESICHPNLPRFGRGDLIVSHNLWTFPYCPNLALETGNWVVTVFSFSHFFSHNFHFPLQCSSWIFDDLPTNFPSSTKKVTFKIFIFSLFLLKLTTILGDFTSLLTGCSRLKKVALVKISVRSLHLFELVQ